jgi:cell wall-associated NlpC family hydrolase
MIVLAAATLTGGALAAVPAAAAAAIGDTGTVSAADQDSTNRLVVHGSVTDRAHPTAATRVAVWINGTYRATVSTTTTHQVNVQLPFDGGTGSNNWVTFRAPGSNQWIANRTIVSLGSRITAYARQYLGHRYVEGGSTPSAFDCSGYTQWVYAHTGAGSLTHNAEAQRRQMHRIPAADLRPGDLIFYMSGGYAYHVAIYDGGGTGLYRGWQFAAATPRAGVIQERVWSTGLQFATTWHR